MRVFVTGATGFIGQAVVKELLDAGHTVVGLARSESKAAELRAKGAEAIIGTIEDVEILKRGASDSEGVIHLAFNHDFTKFAENAKVEYSAIVAIGEALAESNRPFVITSGTLMLSKGELATEDSGADLVSFPNPRAGNEGEITKLATQGVRTSVIRLSPSVHGDDDHGFIYMITQMARAKGESVYIGDGQNKWPAVHRYDAARLYRLALEKGEPGARYHGVGEQGITMKEIAEAIGQEIGVPTVSKTFEEAQVHFGGFMAHAVGADNPTSSKKTQDLLGWTPTGRDLLADIKAGVYSQ
jgi:nucleoside-diphosphate-sugar epimerase